MNFFKYLINNHLWIIAGFLAVCGLFAFVWIRFQDDYTSDLIAMAVLVGFIVTVFLVGNYIKWRRLR